jgi:hypothetical protein
MRTAVGDDPDDYTWRFHRGRRRRERERDASAEPRDSMKHADAQAV